MADGCDITEADVPHLLRAWCALYEGDPEYVKRSKEEQASIRLTLYLGSMVALEKAGALAWPINVDDVPATAIADREDTTGGQ